MTPDTDTPPADPKETAEKPAPSGDAALKAEMERLAQEKQQLFERLARAQAEFQNSRRRLELDQEQALQYANQSLIKKLLPLLDNLERAVTVDPAKAEVSSLLQGVQVVKDQFEAVLKEQRVEIVIPKPGDDFDPAKHEALLQMPSEHESGKVASLLSRGYSLQGRTLRPAQVAISKGQ